MGRGGGQNIILINWPGQNILQVKMLSDTGTTYMYLCGIFLLLKGELTSNWRFCPSQKSNSSKFYAGPQYCKSEEVPKNSHQRRWQIPQPKAAWAWVNLANGILLKMKLDLSFLYALYWHYLFNRFMIIRTYAKNYVKLPKRGKIPNRNHLHTVQQLIQSTVIAETYHEWTTS